jgi:medium-chain acyl-[acyl-carrier-protein] hydrolase
MAERIRAALPWLGAPGRWPALRLFCFPHAGGGASTFRPWLAGGDQQRIQVCPVQPPGRESRWSEPAPSCVEDFAADFIRAASPLLGTPFALLGNSLGALVAYETARQLRARGLPEPGHLLVAAAAAPGSEAGRMPPAGLSDHEFARELQQRYGGIPDLVMHNPDFLREFLPTLRGDIAAVESYRPAPEPPLTVPITALVGADDPGVPAAAVDGWRPLTTGAFARHVLPGGHFALLNHHDLVCRALDDDAPVRPPTIPAIPN